MSPEMLALLLKSFWETCYMVLASTILATLIGVPLGVILTVTRKNHILPNAPVNSVLGAIVNATRSTPFIILMVAIIPLTRLLVGSSIGTTASIVPLTISAAPFIARHHRIFAAGNRPRRYRSGSGHGRQPHARLSARSFCRKHCIPSF